MRCPVPHLILAIPTFLVLFCAIPAASGELLTPDQAAVSNPEQSHPPSRSTTDAVPASGVDSNRARLDRELVWFDDVGAYQGADHNRHLGVSEFYEAVGRPDLVAKEQSARRSASILMAVGGTIFVGGTLWLIGDVLLNTFAAVGTAEPCLLFEVSGGMACQHHDLVDAGPIIATAAGAFILLAGAVSSPRPPTPENARTLATEHNRALTGGASPPYGSVVGDTGSSLRVAPRLTAGGVGMVLAGKF